MKEKSTNDSKIVWYEVGKLNDLSVYESTQGDLAIERGYERLNELSLEEVERWHTQQTSTFSKT